MTAKRTNPQSYATAVRFPADLHSRLGQAAYDRGVSFNWLVIKALEEALERLVPVDEWLVLTGQLDIFQEAT
jgi:hypothetical protein